MVSPARVAARERKLSSLSDDAVGGYFSVSRSAIRFVWIPFVSRGPRSNVGGVSEICGCEFDVSVPVE